MRRITLLLSIYHGRLSLYFWQLVKMSHQLDMLIGFLRSEKFNDVVSANDSICND